MPRWLFSVPLHHGCASLARMAQQGHRHSGTQTNYTGEHTHQTFQTQRDVHRHGNTPVVHACAHPHTHPHTRTHTHTIQKTHSAISASAAERSRATNFRVKLPSSDGRNVALPILLSVNTYSRHIRVQGFSERDSVRADILDFLLMSKEIQNGIKSQRLDVITPVPESSKIRAFVPDMACVAPIASNT